MNQENNVPKKRNPRVVVIALAIICVILAASLVGVIAINLTNDTQAKLAEKDSTISSLQAQIVSLEDRLANTVNASTYVTQIAYLNQQLIALNDTLTSTYAEMLSLQEILQLQSSGSLYSDNFVQDANTTTTIWDSQLDYAGYVAVQVTASASTTYAEVIYSYGGANFDYNQTLGISGTALFPVLPSIVTVKIGNTNQTTSNSITASAVYYY
jgi:predicted PurR-regulated permease PerM